MRAILLAFGFTGFVAATTIYSAPASEDSYCKVKVPLSDPFRQNPPVVYLNAVAGEKYVSPDSKFIAIMCRGAPNNRPTPASYLEIWSGDSLIHRETYFESYNIFSFLNWSQDSKFIYTIQDSGFGGSLVEINIETKIVTSFSASARAPDLNDPRRSLNYRVCTGTLSSTKDGIYGYGFKLLPNRFGDFDAVPARIIWKKPSAEIIRQVSLESINEAELPEECTRYSTAYGGG